MNTNEVRNAYDISIGVPAGKANIERKTQGVRVLSGFIWLRIRSNAGIV
jgi:hypothetical protein